MLTLLEPVMIAFLGVVVGGIVIAMYLPIFGLISQLALDDERGRSRQRLAHHIAVRAGRGDGAARRGPRRPGAARPGALPVNPFFYLIGAVYGVSLLLSLTLRFVDRFRGSPTCTSRSTC